MVPEMAMWLPLQAIFLFQSFCEARLNRSGGFVEAVQSWSEEFMWWAPKIMGAKNMADFRPLTMLEDAHSHVRASSSTCGPGLRSRKQRVR